MKKIAIVGAGYSGALLAVNLLRLRRGQDLRIHLIDKVPRMGRGLAYRTWDDNHLLNVPAGNMSALADDPDDFVAFCQQEDPALGPASFVSRRLYGDYLEKRLHDAHQAGGAALELLACEATAIRRQTGPRPLRIEFSARQAEDYDDVVLAFGHLSPVNPRPEFSFYDSTAYIGNPWDAAAFDAIASSEEVMIIGTGHTAIDVLFRLTNHTDARKIYMVSRRGLLPQTHRPQTKLRPAAEFPAYLRDCPPSARAYSRAIRREVARSQAQGADWRDVIGQLRAHTPALWQRLLVAERARFLKHLVPYWDIHRHRLAPAAHGRFRRLLDSGQVQVLAGRIRGYENKNGRIEVTLAARGSQARRSLSVDRVINCAGPNYDLSRAGAPLIRQLLEAGHIQQDPLMIGLEVSARYEVIDAAGAKAANLYYVGPMLKARDWEAIAVPELRLHTRRLAEVLLDAPAA